MEAPTTFLARIAPQSAAAWQALGGETFPGEVEVETSNRVYRFCDGIFVSRGSRGATEADEDDGGMSNMRLVGFLADEGGLWSLSPRWRPGAHAVMWRPFDDDGPSPSTAAPFAPVEPPSFLLTSPVLSCQGGEPRPVRLTPPRPKTATSEESSSGVRPRFLTRPPVFARPAPPSMTRVHSSDPLPPPESFR